MSKKEKTDNSCGSHLELFLTWAKYKDKGELSHMGDDAKKCCFSKLSLLLYYATVSDVIAPETKL